MYQLMKHLLSDAAPEIFGGIACMVFLTLSYVELRLLSFGDALWPGKLYRRRVSGRKARECTRDHITAQADVIRRPCRLDPTSVWPAQLTQP